MLSTKEKLEKYCDELDNFDRYSTILEIDELVFGEIAREFPDNDDLNWKKSLSKEEKELFGIMANRIFNRRTTIYEIYINRWSLELWTPNEKELEKLKNFQKKFETQILPRYAELKKSIPGYEEVENSSKESKKVLDKLLEKEEHYRKAMEMLRKQKENDDNSGGNQPPPPTDNSELEKKIKTLQSQINALEEKQRKIPNSPTSQQDKQELAKLKRELQEKEKQREKQLQGKKSDFPTGLVVGGGIVVVILLLVVVIFSFRKRQ